MDKTAREEMLRARFREIGVINFFDEQLIELLLCYCPVKDTLELSKRLISHYGTVWNLLNSSLDELMSISGMNERTAILISASGSICRRGLAQHELRTAITCPRRAADILVPRFRGLEKEVVYALYLDSQYLPASIKLIDRGGKSFSNVNIFSLLCDANSVHSRSIIIAHNHPNRDAIPSEPDISCTNELICQLGKIGLRLVDHLIVAGDMYVSLADSGFIDSVDRAGGGYIRQI